MRSVRFAGLLLFASLIAGLPRVEAVIMRLTPLADVLAESNLILVAKVESLDADKLQMVLGVSETLKGKAEFTKLPMLLKGDAEANKGKQVPQLLKRLKADLPMVLFVNQRDREFVAFGYTNGTWFQATGVQPKDADSPRFTWLHFEPYFRRTFKGTTQELRDSVADALAGKKKAPDANAKEEPGLGPEIGEKSGRAEDEDSSREETNSSREETNSSREETNSSRLRSWLAQDEDAEDDGPLQGVFVAPWLLGPLALLGMLFPALFGPLVAGMRRWMTWISVVSINSTLVVVNRYYPGYFNETALWWSMGICTFLGAWLAWGWHVGRVLGANGDAALKRPGRGEVILLSVLAVLGFLPFVFDPPRSLLGMNPLMKTLAIIQAGLLAATFHSCLLAYFRSEKSASPRLPGEGVALLTMLLVSFFLVNNTDGANRAVVNSADAVAGDPTLKGVVWKLDLIAESKRPEAAWIASSPTVVGNRVYFGAVHGSAFTSGAVYCADLADGKILWAFNDNRKMKMVFCSPTVADGCVYIGEGFHQHLGCRLFCLDALTGEKKWEFTTSSHTESTPLVVNGKVYFGAGDDGMYCLDASTGKEVWHLEQLHIDACPLVANGRVYIGSGKGDQYSVFAVLCLDAETGKEFWRTPLDLPSWGKVALAGEMLLVGFGNGDFIASAPRPTGAVLGIEAKTGKRIWQTDLKDGVHAKLVTDGVHVWAASRDQHVVCLTVAEGNKVWAKDLGSPIVASPALVASLPRETNTGLSVGQQKPDYNSLMVVTSAGGVVCLDPKTGKDYWNFDVTRNAGTDDVQMMSSPAVQVRPALEGQGERRLIFFGCGLNTQSRGLLYCLEDTR